MSIARRKKTWVVVILALALMAVGWFCLPGERLLLVRAKRVTSARGWMVERGPDAAISYCWLSSEDVLYCSGSGTPIRQRNVRTGADSPLIALGKHFRRTFGDVDGVSVSPDRQWVMWTGSGDTTVCCRLDGSICRLYPWPLKGYSERSWLGEIGSRWLELMHSRGQTVGPGAATGMIVHDESKSQRGPLVPLARDMQTGSGLRTTIAVEGARGLALFEEVGLVDVFSTPESLNNVTEYCLALPALAPRVYPQYLLKGCTVYRAVISSDGKRVAWLLKTNRSSVLENIMTFILHRAAPPRTLTIGLWVSRVDTGSAEEIGHVQRYGPHGEPPDLLDAYTMQWLPGNKKISFVYGDDLYVVDAP